MTMYVNILAVVGCLVGVNARVVHCAGNFDDDRAICLLRSNPATPHTTMIEGTITFTQAQEHYDNTLVGVHVNITGLPPIHDISNGRFRRHGFHIHEFGNLDNGCSSMGGHYNPDGYPHGSPADPENRRHVGDLGNAIADESGNILMDYFAPATVTLRGARSIIGRGIVLHAGRDDLGRGGDPGSVSSGNAGQRIACCIIQPLVTSV